MLGENTVLTCAHVVMDGDGGPRDDIAVCFVGLPGVPTVRAGVREDGWAPPTEDGRADVALLRLERPVRGVPGAPVADLGVVRDREVHTYGFPDPHEHGVWVNDAKLGGPAGPGGEWVQLNSRVPGERVRGGFSGAGVIDKLTGVVLGMVVLEYTAPESGLAYLLPMGTIAGHVPEVRRWLVEPPPLRRAGSLVIIVGDRDAAVDSGFVVLARKERRMSHPGSPGNGDGIAAVIDATGKSADEVSKHVAEGVGDLGEQPTVLAEPPEVTVAVAGIDDASTPEAVLTDVVKPLMDRGATVLLQFSKPDSPVLSLARQWEREENARRLERLTLLLTALDAAEARTRERAARITPPPEIPARAPGLHLKLRALRAADEHVDPGRVRRALLVTERDAETARLEAERRYAELDPPADRCEELRGLLRSYNAMAASRGLTEDDELAALYRPAMEALAAKPCSPEVAGKLVGAYAGAVRRRLEGA